MKRLLAILGFVLVSIFPIGLSEENVEVTKPDLVFGSGVYRDDAVAIGSSARKFYEANTFLFPETNPSRDIGFDQRRFRLFDVQTGHRFAEFRAPQYGGGSFKFSISPDKTRIAIGYRAHEDAESSLYVIDPANSSVLGKVVGEISVADNLFLINSKKVFYVRGTEVFVSDCDFKAKPISRKLNQAPIGLSMKFTANQLIVLTTSNIYLMKGDSLEIEKVIDLPQNAAGPSDGYKIVLSKNEKYGVVLGLYPGWFDFSSGQFHFLKNTAEETETQCCNRILLNGAFFNNELYFCTKDSLFLQYIDIGSDKDLIHKVKADCWEYPLEQLSLNEEAHILAFVSSNDRKGICLFDTHAKKILKEINYSGDAISGIGISKTGSDIFIFDRAGRIVPCPCLQNGTKLDTLVIGHSRKVLSIGFFDKETIWSSGADGKLIFWNLEKRTINREIAFPKDDFLGAGSGPITIHNGKTIFARNDLGEMAEYSIENGEEIGSYSDLNKAIKFVNTGNTITYLDTIGIVRIYPEEKRDLRLLKANDDLSIQSFTVLDNGEILYASSDSLFSFQDNQINKQRCLRKFNSNIGDLAQIPGSSQVIVALNSGSVEVLDITQLQNKSQCVLQFDDVVECLTVSLNGDIAAGSRNGIIKIWYRNTGVIRTLRGCDFGTVTALNFSSDGMYLLSGGTDCLVKLWKLGK